jgi:hypothetical protein
MAIKPSEFIHYCLVWALNQNGVEVEPIQKHKQQNPSKQLPTGWKQQAGSTPFVSDLLDYETFSAHETIVIESCTGTGKTTAIAKHMTQEQGNFLSILTRARLADQHCKSFKALGMRSY